MCRRIRKLSHTAIGVESATDRPVHFPLIDSNSAVKAKALRGSNSTQREYDGKLGNSFLRYKRT